MVLASGCLPLKAHAVEIEGKRYWDGGYSANPPLIPLMQASDAPEILVVQIMPTLGQRQPRSAAEIVNRLEQVTFNGVLQRELAALRMMIELSTESDGKRAPVGKLGGLKPHHSTWDHHPGLKDENGTDLSWRFLLHLRANGRAAAQAWLDYTSMHDADRFPSMRAAG